MSTLPPVHAPYSPAVDPRQPVIITDIDMTIGAMCRFMVKWAIAAIPAIIILWLLMIAAGVVLALIFGAIFHGAGGLSPWHY